MISPVSSSASAVAELLQSAAPKAAPAAQHPAPSQSGGAYTVSLSPKAAASADVDHDGDSK